eukprot:CAMPEP_0167754332 /NCGR_PEP_ID=MMETSP0110_2-20121227/8211_1 /TAXON_ID=629695 /ORGANISM="Gymnochlora sp., Strain CCMP2014" /LENGTH=525 /DNA_ID=CAMNT_0007640199 /DNA_START=36 /DNA_END=1613 /DNA_ORIENTATION=-
MKAVIRGAKTQWLNEQDITDILVNYSNYGFPISCSAARKPISPGSLFLYNASLGTDWRQDGYQWDPNAENIVKLEATLWGSLHCMVSKGNEVCRRGYWLSSQPNIVLAHYLCINAGNFTNGKETPVFSSNLGQDRMISSDERKETRCDLFLNQQLDFQNSTNMGMRSTNMGMRRIKTSPSALSSLATASPFAKPVDPTQTAVGMGLPILSAQAQPSQNEATASMNQAFSFPVPTTIPTFMDATVNAVQQQEVSANKNGMRRIMSSPIALDRLTSTQSNMLGAGSMVDKMSKRKARKAEVARACRKRKKAYIQSLEQKAETLERKLSEFTRTSAKAKSEEERHRDEQMKLLNEMEKEMSLQHPELKELKKLVTKFVSNSRRSQELHYQQIEKTRKSITPGAQAKFALWGLDQDDEFYAQPGLWKTLMTDEIGLDENQVQSLLRTRASVREVKVELLSLQNKLIELRKNLTTHLNKRHKLLDKLMSTLKPVQLARFLLWVQKNSSCMQMLQTVWKIPEDNPESAKGN